MMPIEQASAVRDVVTEQFKDGHYDDGIRLLQQQEKELPEPTKLECLGNLHFYRKEWQQSVRCYEAAILHDPDYQIARYQYLVGVQEEREGNFVSAFQRYQIAIEIESDFVDPYIELGGLLVKAEDYQGALRCYQDAVRLEPNDAMNWYNLKAVLEELVKIDPERYQTELANAKSAYENYSKSEPLPDHQW